MTPARMAEIHAAAFAGRGQVWSEADFTTLRARPGTDFVAVNDDAFALFQVIAPEAELLTLAVDPPSQGRGLGRIALDTATTLAARLGATTLFLEVAEDNVPARALYARAGFAETGRRRGYYARAGGAPVDAVLLARGLAAEKTGKP